MESVVNLSGYSLEATGRRLRLMEEIREFPIIPGPPEMRQRTSEEVCATVIHYRLHFLSLFLKARVQVFEPVSGGKQVVAEFFVDRNVEASELKDSDKAFEKMISMGYELIDAYLNSCSAYHSALLLQADYEVAFALLVTAIESLSNTYYREGSDNEKFKRFVTDFLPDGRMFLPLERRYFKKELTKDEANALLQELLESAYGRLRSGFIHFGKPSPVGSRLADRLQLAYVKTSKGEPKVPGQEEEEFLNPSFGWFKRIVGEALMNFLSLQASGERKDLHILLLPRFLARMKAGKSIKKGQLVVEDDMELQ